ncbi:hypothetical protein NQ314_021119 [Rhamnusium bicolor]|uniref:Uncharacterized protein n=1 Tax=Rhamnusium bicolor TaxID=1586634 RepID=A0AAV8WK88_9CUCU|nr:hypothetical protein NQ314_021119 [Rhamnusium bicolor]
MYIPPKPEHLDKEIEELSKQIREANAKKMVQLKTFPMIHMSQPVVTRPITEIFSEDWTSVQGQFGWTELADTIIPYLTRSGEKFVSLRMADSKIFLKYKQIFTDEIRDCFKIETLQLTKAEAQLLNEINIRHCDNFFGQLDFTVNEIGLVTIKEITEMYEFLDFCYVKLIERNPATHKRCGFIRIASQNCVPYVWYENKQYVPLFYFEGECKYLEERSMELRGWELAYLKLSCKIQGIRKALFDADSIHVVELELLKKFFPPDTPFEDIWPIECKVETLIRKPVPRLVTLETNNRNNETMPNVQGNPNYTVAIQKKLPKTKATVQKVSTVEMPFSAHMAGMKNSVTTTLNGLKPPPSTYSYRNDRSVPGAPNICQVSNNQSTYMNQYLNSISTTTDTGMSHPSNTLTTTSVPRIMNYQRTNMPYVNKETYPNPGICATNTVGYNQTPLLRPVTTPDNSGAHVLQIPDFICNNTGSPYFLLRAQVEDKYFNFCINLEPYVTTILMVSLEEISTTFFGIPMDLVLNAVNVMRLNIFFPNKVQIRVLERAKRYPTKGLIKLKDFIDNLPQIRYILTHN